LKKLKNKGEGKKDRNTPEKPSIHKALSLSRPRGGGSSCLKRDPLYRRKRRGRRKRKKLDRLWKAVQTLETLRVTVYWQMKTSREKRVRRKTGGELGAGANRSIESFTGSQVSRKARGESAIVWGRKGGGVTGARQFHIDLLPTPF